MKKQELERYQAIVRHLANMPDFRLSRVVRGSTRIECVICGGEDKPTYEKGWEKGIYHYEDCVVQIARGAVHGEP